MSLSDLVTPDKNIPARSEIPIIPDVPNGVPGQQHTYMLILRASFSNSWTDLAKVFDTGWNGPDRVMGSDGEVYEDARPNPEIGRDEFRYTWLNQMWYPRDEDGMRNALRELQSRQDFVIRSFDKERLEFKSRPGDFADVMRVIQL